MIEITTKVMEENYPWWSDKTEKVMINPKHISTMEFKKIHGSEGVLIRMAYSNNWFFVEQSYEEAVNLIEKCK